MINITKLSNYSTLLIDKDYVKVRKNTLDSMRNVIKETKKAIEFHPKIKQLFNEVDTYTKSHQTLEKENQDMQQEIKSLKTKNRNLIQENNNQDFDMYDVKDISKGNAKEDELFDYAKVPSYLKSSKKCNKEKNKDDFELSL